jgi:hypothetical protein
MFALPGSGVVQVGLAGKGIVVVVNSVVLSDDDELVTAVVFDDVVDGVIPDKVDVVEIDESKVVVRGAGQVVDAHMQSNQSPLLNCEYTRTFVPFDK